MRNTPIEVARRQQGAPALRDLEDVNGLKRPANKHEMDMRVTRKARKAGTGSNQLLEKWKAEMVLMAWVSGVKRKSKVRKIPVKRCRVVMTASVHMLPHQHIPNEVSTSGECSTTCSINTKAGAEADVSTPSNLPGS